MIFVMTSSSTFCCAGRPVYRWICPSGNDGATWAVTRVQLFPYQGCQTNPSFLLQSLLNKSNVLPGIPYHLLYAEDDDIVESRKVFFPKISPGESGPPPKSSGYRHCSRIEHQPGIQFHAVGHQTNFGGFQYLEMDTVQLQEIK